jgi:hypothetical protein
MAIKIQAGSLLSLLPDAMGVMTLYTLTGMLGLLYIVSEGLFSRSAINEGGG